MRKTIVLSLLLSLLFYPIAFSEMISISGKIENISVLDDGRIQLDISTAEGSSTFFVDSQSLIQEPLNAIQVKKGQTILLPDESAGSKGVKGIKGIKGIESPFGNISPNAAKALGLPNVPSVPSVPNIPSVPEVPNVPDVPQVPQVPGGAAPPQMGGGEEQQKGGGASEEGIPDLPQDPAFQQLNPNPISDATVDTSSSATATPKRVVSAKKTNAGVQVKFEGDAGQEEITLPAEGKVFQLLTIQDLKQNMDVTIEADGINARQITII